jgi:hypothetical protein
MRLSPKTLLTAFVAALPVLTADRAGADPAGKSGGVEKTKAPTVPATGNKAEPPKEGLDLAVPKGQPQKGVRVPVYGLDGKLMMNFQIGVAIWVDDENIKMTELRVETFKQDGEKELEMDLPDSILNTRTKDITSKTTVSIKRDDFEISGNTMTFNTESRQGKLGGGVRMVIYNLNSSSDKKPRATGKPTVKFEPAKEEAK